MMSLCRTLPISMRDRTLESGDYLRCYAVIGRVWVRIKIIDWKKMKERANTYSENVCFLHECVPWRDWEIFEMWGGCGRRASWFLKLKRRGWSPKTIGELTNNMTGCRDGKYTRPAKPRWLRRTIWVQEYSTLEHSHIRVLRFEILF